MLINIDFFNPLEKQGLEDICIDSSYPAVDLILDNFHLVSSACSDGNSLPPKAVNQSTVNDFKNIIDIIFRKRRGYT